MQNQLPELCFSTLPGTGDLICIKRRETGYYPSDWNTGDAEKNRELADYNNRRLGVTYAMERAFLTASMTNWDVHGANPQFYLDHAEYQGGRLIQGHIKDDVMTVYYPTEGMLYQYKIDDREQQYLSLDAVPVSAFYGENGVTVLPDLVCGKPLVQVEAAPSDNGNYTLNILRHCFSHDDKETNTGYRIDMRMQVGGQEIVMGWNGKAPARYVTWLRTPANDRAGPHNFYWGHYADKRENAIDDFCERAHREYQYLLRRTAQPAPNNKRQQPER